MGLSPLTVCLRQTVFVKFSVMVKASLNPLHIQVPSLPLGNLHLGLDSFFSPISKFPMLWNPQDSPAKGVYEILYSLIQFNT